jgi:hypothetical protein
MVDEGSSANILASSTWQALGSPNLVSATNELLAFDIKPSEYLRILPQLPITLDGKTFLVNMLVV